MKSTTHPTTDPKAARDAALRAALRELEADCHRRGIVIPEELRRAAREREAHYAELQAALAARRVPAGDREDR